jgi:glycine betaine/proline transport system ATP-binding protein
MPTTHEASCAELGPRASGDDEPHIRVRSLWKIYGAREKEALSAMRDGHSAKTLRSRYGSIVGVADVNLDVSRGEVLCIMGLSGSGKSTMLRLVNRLIEPTDGSILIDGRDVMAMPERMLRELRGRSVSMVFQHMALWPHRTVRDNVAFGLEVRGIARKKRKETADRALELVKLAGWEDQYPDQLSGGMQQRVGLARALASDPEILLMDEPFSALDPLIRRSLQDEFVELTKSMRKTTIFITHDLEEAIKIGTRIAVMKEGRVVQLGAPHEIVTNPVDDYVAAFVESVAIDRRLYAGAIMRPLAEGDSSPPLDSVRGRVAASASLRELLDAFEHEPGELTVIDAGRPAGLVSRDDLIRAMQKLHRCRRSTGAEASSQPMHDDAK